MTKSVLIKVRFREHELKAIDEAADRANKTRSCFIRDLLLDACSLPKWEDMRKSPYAKAALYKPSFPRRKKK